MLSQRQAAQVWGVSRATLQRAISSGKLSVSAEGRIDPAEMLRVFGAAKSSSKSGPHEPLGPPLSRGDEPPLKAENQALRAALAAKEELIVAKDRHIADLSQALRLLTGPSTSTPKLSFWQRLFGRS
jgi:hypothetical protein